MNLIEYEKISIADACRAIDREPTEADDRLAHARSDDEPDVLLSATLAWMADLPSNVRPVALPQRFSRIANRLAATWCQVARCEEYFDTLILDSRGNRSGFPEKVAQELNTLRGFYAELHPYKRSGWDWAEGN